MSINDEHRYQVTMGASDSVIVYSDRTAVPDCVSGNSSHSKCAGIPNWSPDLYDHINPVDREPIKEAIKRSLERKKQIEETILSDMLEGQEWIKANGPYENNTGGNIDQTIDLESEKKQTGTRRHNGSH